MDNQDWEEVTIRSKKPRLSSPLRNQSVKYNNVSSELRKIENAETGKPRIITPKSRSDMAAARMARNLTQKQLDMLCKFPSNTTNAFEAGRICPTSIQIQSLNRILNIKLERE